MAKSSIEVIQALRNTAKKLEHTNQYQWGHMGLCNCGFLAQEVTKLTKTEIHRRAMQSYGDWSEQLNDYCPTSGLPMDNLIAELLTFGFDSEDLKHLEKLSDKRILQQLPSEKRNLHHNSKKDAITYLHTWANLLEEELLGAIQLKLEESTTSTSFEAVHQF
ncbi:MAG: hypothetical protein ACKO96_21160 [Flammeovirgaceae bacterium]